MGISTYIVERNFDLPLNGSKIDFSRLENNLEGFISSDPQFNVASINLDASLKDDFSVYIQNGFSYKILGEFEKGNNYIIKVGADI